MPQIKAAKKTLRSSKRKRAVNDRWRKRMRESYHTAKKAMEEKDKKKAQEEGKKTIKEIDRAARRNIIHPNKAARKKSRLQKAINAL
jgi:small subunit ribosomal protein S20